MADDLSSLSDDEIIAHERRKSKKAIISALVFWPIVACGIILLFAIQDGAFPNAGMLRTGARLLLRGFPLLLLASVWLLFLRFRPSKEALTDRIQRKRIDEFQGRFRIGLLLFIIVAGVECFGFGRQPSFAVRNLYSQLLFVFLLMMFAAAITFGQGWLSFRPHPSRDDELVRALRAQVTRIGYLLLMVALGAVYLVQLYRPELVSVAVRGSLFAGIAIPALSYLFLEWRAGRGG